MAAIEDKVYLLNSFDISVPENYDHKDRLLKFGLMEEKNFYFFGASLTDQNFAHTTADLLPGRKYDVNFFGIKQGEIIPPDDCLEFLATQNNILVGPQGLVLIRQLRQEKFPVNKLLTSFNEKSHVVDDRLMFLMKHDQDNNWFFLLQSFSKYLLDSYVLVCVSAT